jgi:hypothetical protein
MVNFPPESDRVTINRKRTPEKVAGILGLAFKVSTKSPGELFGDEFTSKGPTITTEKGSRE